MHMRPVAHLDFRRRLLSDLLRPRLPWGAHYGQREQCEALGRPRARYTRPDHSTAARACHGRTPSAKQTREVLGRPRARYTRPDHALLRIAIASHGGRERPANAVPRTATGSAAAVSASSRASSAAQRWPS